MPSSFHELEDFESLTPASILANPSKTVATPTHGGGSKVNGINANFHFTPDEYDTEGAASSAVDTGVMVSELPTSSSSPQLGGANTPSTLTSHSSLHKTDEFDLENGELLQAAALAAAGAQVPATEPDEPIDDGVPESTTQPFLNDKDIPGAKLSLRKRAYNILHSIIFAYAGVKLLLLAQVFNSAMVAFTQLLETASDPPFHPFQILFSRMLITYLGCVCFMAYRKVPDFILGPKGIRHLLVLRGVLGFFGVFGLYYSVNYLDMSDAAVITFLTPSVTAFIAWYFLGEPLIAMEVISGFIALVGVIIISRPAFLFGMLHKQEHDPSDDVPEKMRIRAVMVALLGVCGASFAYVMIRKIGRRAHPLVSVSYFALWAFLVSTVGLLVTPGLGFVFPRTFMQWGLLFLLGLFGFLFQFCLTAGIQRVTVGRAAAATYTLMLWTLVWEKMLWNKTPDKTSIAGGSLILGSGIIVVVFKWWEARQAKAEQQQEVAWEEEEEAVNRSQLSRDTYAGALREERDHLLDHDDSDEFDISSDEDDEGAHQSRARSYSFTANQPAENPIPLLDLPSRNADDEDQKDSAIITEEELAKLNETSETLNDKKTKLNANGQHLPTSHRDTPEPISRSTTPTRRFLSNVIPAPRSIVAIDGDDKHSTRQPELDPRQLKAAIDKKRNESLAF